MRKYIENILNELQSEKCPSVPFRYRRYGALECALQVVGILGDSGTKFGKNIWMWRMIISSSSIGIGGWRHTQK